MRVPPTVKEAPAPDTVFSTATPTMNSSRQRCSILVVDDEAVILALLREQLRHEYDVFTARSIAEAREQVAVRDIDIVLSDLNLPDGSGIALLEWARQSHPRISRVLLTGMARLEDAAEAINRSQVHRIVLKPWQRDDLLGSLRSITRTLLLERNHEKLLDEYRALLLNLENRVVDRTRELEQKNHLLEKMALTDVLTGIPNRRAVELIARKELLRRARTTDPIAIGIIDVDHFKDINSAHLLVGGDHVLTWLAQLLQATVRSCDSIGRIGGEEFMIVAPNTDAVGIDILGERVRNTIERARTTYHGKTIGITVSIGFAAADPGSLFSFEELRVAAASALAEAKISGRNRCIIQRMSSPVAILN